MIQQTAFAGGNAALLDLLAKPLVMLERVGQKIQGHLIGEASGFGGKPIQFGFQLWRNMQIHEVSVGVTRRAVKDTPDTQTKFNNVTQLTFILLVIVRDCRLQTEVNKTGA